jgi:hypothetical protein
MHHLAAAIHTHARVIVTYNRRDFPADTLPLMGLKRNILMPSLCSYWNRRQTACAWRSKSNAAACVSHHRHRKHFWQFSCAKDCPRQSHDCAHSATPYREPHLPKIQRDSF